MGAQEFVAFSRDRLTNKKTPINFTYRPPPITPLSLEAEQYVESSAAHLFVILSKRIGTVLAFLLPPSAFPGSHLGPLSPFFPGGGCWRTEDIEFAHCVTVRIKSTCKHEIREN